MIHVATIIYPTFGYLVTLPMCAALLPVRRFARRVHLVTITSQVIFMQFMGEPVREGWLVSRCWRRCGSLYICYYELVGDGSNNSMREDGGCSYRTSGSSYVSAGDERNYCAFESY